MRIIWKVYSWLLDHYGPQGWWPLLDRDTMTLRYHPGDYTPPSHPDEVFQVMAGAVLTQNTSWNSAAMALIRLADRGALDARSILEMDDHELQEAVRCAGFYRQKSSYLRGVAEFFLSLDGSSPTRKELLGVRGVGEETADSILLYGYRKPEFVVDAYTRRIFSRLGVIGGDERYSRIKELFEGSLEADFRVFQEYHALIVRHGKTHYRKKPYGEGDRLPLQVKGVEAPDSGVRGD